MTQSWDDRITSFWASADDSRPGHTLAVMRRLVEERPADDPEALYEWASVHDFLGLEAEAVPLYRAALDAGLAGDRRPQAVIQLASSLRNIGDAEAAAAVLRDHPRHPVTGSAAEAFLALALYDAGRPGEALRVALGALAPTLPLYQRAVLSYAAELTDRDGAR
jgi:tetratricopeptide (TPR) repeat protein